MENRLVSVFMSDKYVLNGMRDGRTIFCETEEEVEKAISTLSKTHVEIFVYKIEFGTVARFWNKVQVESQLGDTYKVIE